MKQKPRKSTAGVILYLILVSTLLVSMNYNWAYDDPFITYRYAQNLSEGQGFVFNPGQRILSTTTPLFAVLLAVLSLVWSDHHLLAILVSACSLSIGGLFIWDMARTQKILAIGWIGLLVYPFFPLLRVTLGSEMPLYLAFCLGTFAFYVRGKYSLSAFFLALAVMTRPDAILIPAILVLHYLIQVRKPIPWKVAVIFVGSVLPWIIFAWIYFGSPIPVTLIAKQHQGLLPVSQRFATGFLTIIKTNYITYEFYRYATVIAILGAIYALIKKRSWLLIPAWSTAFFTTYTILGVSRYFWYYAPLVPGYLILAGLGIACIYDICLFVLRRSGGISTALTSRYLLFSFLVSIPIIIGQFSLTWQTQNPVDSRYQIYHKIGNWIKQNTPENASVGSFETGIIGYFSRHPIIDFAGLLQPDVAYQLRSDSGYDEAAKWAMDTYHPNYVLLQVGIYPEMEDDYIARHCSVVKLFTGENYNYQGDFKLYECTFNSDTAP